MTGPLQYTSFVAPPLSRLLVLGNGCGRLPRCSRPAGRRGLGATAGTVRARVCVVHLRLVCARPCNVAAHRVVVVHYHHCQPRHRGWPGTRAPHPGCHHGRRRQHASHGAPRRRQHASHGAAASSLDPRRSHGYGTYRDPMTTEAMLAPPHWTSTLDKQPEHEGPTAW